MDYMNLPFYVIHILALTVTFHLNFVQLLANECSLDMNVPSSWDESKLTSSSSWGNSNWGGFLNSDSCVSPFERYLYALSKKSNKTGEIFIDITELNDCTIAIDDGDLTSCGIERLTSGNGGCSNYSVSDVVNKLGSELQNLDKHCNNLGLESESNYRACAVAWINLIGPANNSDETTSEGSDICRFSVLITLTSRMIDSVERIKNMYMCLRDGISEDDQASAGNKSKSSRELRNRVLIGGVGSVTSIAAIVMLFLIKRKSKKELPPRITRQEPPNKFDARDASYVEEASDVMITLKEVYAATNDLSASNFIGQGVAGKVYKGILSNGQRVAIKHIMNDGHMESFVREVTSLSHVKHPNLVKLLGHCDGEDESFLVYELCDNGNLSEWLFGKQKFLTWVERLEIAIDCARGLWFLHTYPEGCIVHRDIKPTNILLGTNFEGKLSDFGLSKVICTGVSFVSSEVRGTFGYVDPEYQKNRHVHSSTDVYSFGIVLLQLLSGQRVINLDVTKPMPLSKMAKNITKEGDITEFADPKLNGKFSSEGFELVFKLALACIGTKQQRPSMENVVVLLEEARCLSKKLNLSDSSFEST